MKALFFAALAGSLVATTVSAECPAKTPSNKRINIQQGDERVNAAWLNKHLSGQRVSFEQVGTEYYQANGSYAWKQGSQKWEAPSYRFYDNGFRCIDYPSPRFDLYVVNNGKLVLIDGTGGRYIGEILK